MQSADAQVFTNYVLVALAAVALGGTNMAGGRGGLVLSVVGAASIFLLENLLTDLHASAYFIQVAYGGVLFIAVLLGSPLFDPAGGRRMSGCNTARRRRSSPPPAMRGESTLPADRQATPDPAGDLA